MSKHNGKRKGVKKYHFEKPDALPLKDGISIIAVGDREIPTEIHIIVKVPGAKVAPRLRFHKHELLTDLIEQLIAYRRWVFPDAPEIDTNVTMEE
jgi:hypothetical protein